MPVRTEFLDCEPHGRRTAPWRASAILACLLVPAPAAAQDPVASCVPGRSIAISGYDEAGFRSAIVEQKALRVGVESRNGFKAGLDALASAFPGVHFLESPLPRGEMSAALERGVIDVTPYPCDLVLASPSDFAGRFDGLNVWLLAVEGVPPPPPPPPNAETVHQELRKTDEQLGDLYGEGSELLQKRDNLSGEIGSLEDERGRLDAEIKRLERLTEASGLMAEADRAVESGDFDKADELFNRSQAVLRESCDGGDSEACFRGGDDLEYWDGNEERAVELYRRACDMGHAEACTRLE